MLWRSLNLRWRMTIILVLLPLLLVMPGFIYIGGQYRNAYREARLSKAAMVNQQLVQTLGAVEPYISSLQDLPDLDRFLQQSILGQEEMVFASVVLENGTILYHSLPGVRGTSDGTLTELHPAAGFQRREVMSVGYRDVYLVSQQLPLSGSEGQQVHVVVGLQAALVDPPFLAWGPALVGVVAAFLLVFILQVSLGRLIFKPLDTLAEGATIIGAGDLQYRIPIAGDDEVSFLARRFNEMAERLRELVVALEEKVQAGAEELDLRRHQLEAVAVVGRGAVNIRSVPLLLKTTVDAISERFGYYHAGIFLVDEGRAWARLMAASSEGGQRMLARNHRLRVGRQGIVGMTVATAEPRIALDVGEDSVWFNTPELPNTRSEMALPLVDDSGAVIGVLDVQSSEPNAFSQGDVRILRLLADQLSVALQNARLSERAQQALEELDAMQQDETRAGWARIVSRLRPQAYEYDRLSVNPVLPVPTPEGVFADQAAARTVRQGGVTTLFEPVQYRGQTLGMIALSDPGREWTDEELELIEGVSDQVAVALENARLFEEAQRNARHQALLNYVLNAASSTSLGSGEALGDIAGILSQGLGMAVGIFTFLNTEEDKVQLQAFLTPEGEPLLPAGTQFSLGEERKIFFAGLEHPALGTMLPLVDLRTMGEDYELERVLYVAISTAAARIGFMAMVQRKDDALLDAETRFLARSLAQQVGVVIENLRLLEETQRRSAELQALYEVSLRLGETLEVEVIYALVVEQARRLFEAESCGIFIYDIPRNKLHLRAVEGGLGRYPDLALAPGEGLSGQVFATREPIYVESYTEWEGRADSIVRGEFGPALGVPLIAAEGVRGVLFIARAPENPVFDPAHIRLAELFASQVTVGLESARLYQESATRAADLQQLYMAGLDLVSRLNVEEVLEQGAEWTCRLLGGQRATIFYQEEGQETFRVGRAVELSLEEESELENEVEALRTDLVDPMGLGPVIFESGEVLILDDIRDDDRLWGLLGEFGVRGLVAAPLRFGQRVLGVVYVQSTEANIFSVEDIHLMEFLGSQIATAVENAALFARTETALEVVADQARSQTNVARATALLAEQGTEVLEEVLALLGETAEVSRCVYFRAQDTTPERPARWQVEAMWNDPHTGPLVLPSESFEVVLEWLPALRQGASYVKLSDAEPAARVFMEIWKAQSFLGLPVVGTGAHLPGLLAFVNTHEERSWEAEEIAPLQTVAASISSTLARERLFQQVQDALAETEILYKAGTALNVADTYQEILEVMAEYTLAGEESLLTVVQLFDRPWTPDERPEGFRIVARRGTVPALSLEERYPISTFPVLLDVLSLRGPVMIENVMEDSRLDPASRHAFHEMMGAHSVLFVPLLVSGRGIGFVTALYAQPTSLSEVQRRRLTSVAAQAAVAVQNRYQLDATAARARREQRIREIVGEIQAAPDVQSVLQTATRELGRALRTSHSAIHLGSNLGSSRAAGLGTGPLSADGGEGKDGRGGNGHE